MSFGALADAYAKGGAWTNALQWLRQFAARGQAFKVAYLFKGLDPKKGTAGNLRLQAIACKAVLP